MISLILENPSDLSHHTQGTCTSSTSSLSYNVVVCVCVHMYMYNVVVCVHMCVCVCVCRSGEQPSYAGGVCSLSHLPVGGRDGLQSEAEHSLCPHLPWPEENQVSSQVSKYTCRATGFLLRVGVCDFSPPPPPLPSPTSLAAHDVVITTYDTIGSEGAAALSDVSTPLSHLPSTVSPLSSSVG